MADAPARHVTWLETQVQTHRPAQFHRLFTRRDPGKGAPHIRVRQRRSGGIERIIGPPGSNSVVRWTHAALMSLMLIRELGRDCKACPRQPKPKIYGLSGHRNGPFGCAQGKLQAVPYKNGSHGYRTRLSTFIQAIRHFSHAHPSRPARCDQAPCAGSPPSSQSRAANTPLPPPRTPFPKARQPHTRSATDPRIRDSFSPSP